MYDTDATDVFHDYDGIGEPAIVIGEPSRTFYKSATALVVGVGD
jgi:hypothetical protein